MRRQGEAAVHLLEEDRACIGTSDEPLPAGALPARGSVITADDLRLGPAVVARAADRASGVEDLLVDLASGWLAGTGDEGRRPWPWLQPLDDAWATLPTAWHEKGPPDGAPPQHEMIHQGTDGSGMEEWRCPVCGRHFIVRWPPDFERLVLTEGDGNAFHIGRKSEPGLTGIQIAPAPHGEDEWRRWLRDNGIDWDGEVA